MCFPQAWSIGTFAEYEGKVGKLTIRPDSDQDVKLEWADGSGVSSYAKVATLTKATQAEWDAAVRAVRPRTDVPMHAVDPCFVQPRPALAVFALGETRLLAYVLKGHNVPSQRGFIAAETLVRFDSISKHGLLNIVNSSKIRNQSKISRI